MRYAFAASVALFGAWAFQPALAQSPNPLVAKAVEAQGGAAAFKALKGLSIKGEAKHWEPEQSKTADGEARFLGDSTFSTTIDLAAGSASTDWNRDMKYPAVEVLKFIETVTPAGGYTVTDGKPAAMSGIRVAAQLRELNRAAANLLAKALDDPKSVGAMGPQKLGKDSLAAVSVTQGGTKFTVLFDKVTHLPAAIRTKDDDFVHGDVNFDLVLGDWKSVGGVKVAHSLTYRMNDMDVAKVTYKEVAANPAIAANAFAVPDAVKSALKGPSSGTVPYQWVLRRLYLGRFLDSDAVMVPVGGTLKLVELTPNVQQVVGGSGNNLIVAMKDGLVVFDAPVGEIQSRWVINAAKQRYPGKPIKYLVLTHHHMDHTGGSRAYVAEGATVVVAAPTKAHWDAMLKQPRTVAPDAQENARKPVKVVEVKDDYSIKDADGEIRLHNIPNPHVDGMLIGHVVKDNVVWVTDLYSPGRDTKASPGSQAVAAAAAKYGIKDAIFAGGHGSNGKQSALDAILAAR